MVKERKVSETDNGKVKVKKTVKRKTKAETSKTSSKKTVIKKSSVNKADTSKKKKESKLSDTAHYILMAIGAFLFVACFYFFFIRPYSYRWKPCYGMKAYGVCLPHGYTVHGIDISHHQGTVNWDELKHVQFAEFPVRFVFMKATEGGDFKDIAFDSNFDNAGKHRFIRGAYHFYNPQTDPVKQADFYIDNVSLKAGDLPPVLDIEKKAKDIDKLRKDLRIWLDRIEAHYKVKPILYTSYKFKTKYLNDPFFDRYPYWIAHYYVDSVRYEGEWKFWQHTDVGTLPGIRKQVDLNVFNGSMSELLEMTIQDEK